MPSLEFLNQSIIVVVITVTITTTIVVVVVIIAGIIRDVCLSLYGAKLQNSSPRVSLNL